jgi:uncharacterized Zn-finger protein
MKNLSFRMRQKLASINEETDPLDDTAEADLASSLLTTAAATNPEQQQLFSCTTCPKSFASAESLKRHMKYHVSSLTPKQFMCAVCNADFSKLETLTTHMRLHAGGRPYSCTECGESFMLKKQLSQHQEAAHRAGRAGASKEQQRSCPICDKTFIRSTILAQHMKYFHPGK